MGASGPSWGLRIGTGGGAASEGGGGSGARLIEGGTPRDGTGGGPEASDSTEDMRTELRTGIGGGVAVSSRLVGGFLTCTELERGGVGGGAVAGEGIDFGTQYSESLMICVVPGGRGVVVAAMDVTELVEVLVCGVLGEAILTANGLLLCESWEEKERECVMFP